VPANVLHVTASCHCISMCTIQCSLYRRV
jgi:hypothetical protein